MEPTTASNNRGSSPREAYDFPPTNEYVFPLPVGPYSSSVTLAPPSSGATKGAPTAENTSACVAAGPSAALHANESGAPSGRERDRVCASRTATAVGGGCALAAVTAGEPGRREYFIKYYGGMLGRPGGRAPP